jgi:hypothetical protein
MAKTELKTQRNRASVAAFLKSIQDPEQRADCTALVALMRTATGEKPEMWGASIVGFGSFHYVGKSGREGDWMLTGFSPRKQNTTIYFISGFKPFAELLPKLGKHKTSAGSCLAFKRLEDLHLPTLRKMVKESIVLTRKMNVPKS